jgi:hypothetical protein
VHARRSDPGSMGFCPWTWVYWHPQSEPNKLLTNISPAPGRKTRSGKEFSPYVLTPGPPIRVETDFDIAQALSDLNDVHIACEDEGFESEDERDVEPPLLPSTFSCAPSPSSSASAPALPSPVSRKSENPPVKRTRKQEHSKKSRRLRRSAKQELLPLETRHLKSVALKKRKNLEPISTPIDSESLSAASSGWVGVRIPNEQGTFALEEVTKAPYNLCHI